MVDHPLSKKVFDIPHDTISSLHSDKLGTVEFQYRKDDEDGDIIVQFHPENKRGYKAIAVSSRYTVTEEPQMIDRDDARDVWNHLLLMGFE